MHINFRNKLLNRWLSLPTSRVFSTFTLVSKMSVRSFDRREALRPTEIRKAMFGSQCTSSLNYVLDSRLNLKNTCALAFQNRPWLQQKNYLDFFVSQLEKGVEPNEALKKLEQIHHQDKKYEATVLALLPKHKSLDHDVMSKLQAVLKKLEHYGLEAVALNNKLLNTKPACQVFELIIRLKNVATVSTHPVTFSYECSLSHLQELHEVLETFRILSESSLSPSDALLLLKTLSVDQGRLLQCGIHWSQIQKYTPAQASLWRVLKEQGKSHEDCLALLNRYPTEVFDLTTFKQLLKRGMDSEQALKLMTSLEKDALWARVLNLPAEEIQNLSSSQREALSEYHDKGLTRLSLLGKNWYDGVNVIDYGSSNSDVPYETDENIFYHVFKWLVDEKQVSCPSAVDAMHGLTAEQVILLKQGLSRTEILETSKEQKAALVYWKNKQKQCPKLSRLDAGLKQQAWFREGTVQLMKTHINALVNLIESEDCDRPYDILNSLSFVSRYGLSVGLSLKEAMLLESEVAVELLKSQPGLFTLQDLIAHPWFKENAHFMALEMLKNRYQMDTQAAFSLIARFKHVLNPGLLSCLENFLDTKLEDSQRLNDEDINELSVSKLCTLAVLKPYGITANDLLQATLPLCLMLGQLSFNDYASAFMQVAKDHKLIVAEVFSKLYLLNAEQIRCVAKGYLPEYLKELTEDQLCALIQISATLDEWALMEPVKGSRELHR